MGIDGLPKYITRYAGSAVSSYKLSKFKGWKVSVDTSLLLYQIVKAMRAGNSETVNDRGELTSHLQGIFNKVLGFLQNGIIPIFVFDGKSPDIKRVTSELRKCASKKAEDKLVDTDLDTDSLEYCRLYAQAYHATHEHFEEAKILLDLMGVPYVLAPEEADPVCVWLTVRKDENGKRYANGVATEDSDMLPLGTPYLLKNMLSAVTKNSEVTVIRSRRTLMGLGITREQFVETCVMLGTDYSNNIKGVGPVATHNLMEKHGSLDEIIKVYRKKLKGEESFENNAKCMGLAKEYFMTALQQLDDNGFGVTEDQTELSVCQKDNLIDFLVNKHNFEPSGIVYKVSMLEQYHKSLDVTRPNTKETHVNTGKIDYRIVASPQEYEFD